jgi:phage-related protein
MRTIQFYRTANGTCPVQEYLDRLDPQHARKAAWVMRLIRRTERPPVKFFKKLTGTALWEIRAECAGNAYRFLGFKDGNQLVILASGFSKKTIKTPRQEIETALNRRRDYFSRKK